MLSVYYIQLSNSLSSSSLRLPLPNTYVVACVSAPAAFTQTPTPLSVQPPVTTAGPVRSLPKSYVVTSPPKSYTYTSTASSKILHRYLRQHPSPKILHLHRSTPKSYTNRLHLRHRRGRRHLRPGTKLLLRRRSGAALYSRTKILRRCLLPVSICKYFAKTRFKRFFAKCIC